MYNHIDENPAIISYNSGLDAYRQSCTTGDIGNNLYLSRHREPPVSMAADASFESLESRCAYDKDDLDENPACAFKLD